MFSIALFKKVLICNFWFWFELALFVIIIFCVLSETVNCSTFMENTTVCTSEY